MTQSVLTFKLLPGKRQEFIDTFLRIEVLQQSSFQAGYLGGQLHFDVDDPEIAMVTAQWESPAAYQGWLDNPVRETIGEQLEPFFAEDPTGRVVKSVIDIAPETEPGGSREL
jgi:quinol monooxygenase YgiN